MCLVLGQATSFVAVFLYSSRLIEHDRSPTISTNDLWYLVGSLEAAFIIFFSVFIVSVNRKYVKTFFSTMTAKQYRAKAFREAKNDQSKIAILHYHPSYYASFRNEVVEWVSENFETWNEEKPDWFMRVKKNIPLDMIPTTTEEDNVVSESGAEAKSTT